MADISDPKDIARRYLDLWLDHWERSARDPEAVDAMARMVQEAVSQQADFQRNAAASLFGAGAGPAFASLGPWLTVMQSYANKAGQTGAGQQDETSANATDPDATAAPGTDGASAAGTASGDGPERVAQLVQRIAELESRIEHLERSRPARTSARASDRTGGSTTSPPARRRRSSPDKRPT
ncbi:MAG: hypothetical protein AAGF58_04410 [Pseudomonadota bacterium]